MHTENLTIVFVDIAGFTATTNRQSRRQNACLLDNFESLLRPLIRKFAGRIIKSIGDALLLTFHSPTDAMLCACRMQDRLALYTQQNPTEQAIVIRIAAHLGEVRTARHDVFGEAVNLAARIEAVTPAGEIYLSEAVYLAMNKTEVPVQSAGQFTLAGFDHPLTLYQVQKDAAAKLPFGSAELELKPPSNLQWRWLGFFILFLAFSVWFYSAQQPPRFKPSPLPQTQQPQSHYLQIHLQEMATAQLSPESQFGIKHALQQAVDRLSGLYVAQSQNEVENTYILHVTWEFGVFPQASQLHFSLVSPSQEPISTWSINWQQQQSQQNLQQVEQQLFDRFFALGMFRQLQPMEQQIKVPDSFYQHFLAALQALQQGEARQDIGFLTQAKEQLQLVQQALPEFHQANRALCHTFCALSELTEQAAWLSAAKNVCVPLSKNSGGPADLMAYARYLSINKHHQQAQKVLLQVLADNPKAGQAYTLLSKIYLEENQPLEAELILKRAISMQPDYWPALQMLAVFLLEQGQFEAAISHFQKITVLAPDNATALTNLGSTYLLHGQLQAAADTYQLALKKSNEPFILANLATVYYYLGRLQDAIALYQQAIRQDQTDYVLHGNIADAYRQHGQHIEAILHYRQASQLLEQKVNLGARDLALHAHYQAQLGEHKQSQVLMTKALTKNQQTAEVWLLDAILKVHTEQFSVAIQSIEKALQLGYPAKLIAVDPDLQPLAEYPEFLALLRP